MSDELAVLVLEDGTTFHGRSFGAVGETFGEAVFATGMTGYQETLTDPSYHRQVVVATTPHIGNTGWNDEDNESSRIWVAGYVVRDPSPQPSNWRSRRSLDAELAAQGIVGVRGIDTRLLTRHLREHGAMRVGVSSLQDDAEVLLERVLASPAMVGADLVSQVSTQRPYTVPSNGRQHFTVAALDLGLKANIVRLMAGSGMTVHVLPAHTDYDTIAGLCPDGMFLSNGPGDPATTDAIADVTRQALADAMPVFGICFGHQVFGRALGFGTYKLKYGHRGLNQPVKDLRSGRVEITAHNHGFAVEAPTEGVTTQFGQASVSHICLNDDVVEGLELYDRGALRAFSVQYHPEAAAGPHDARHLFDRFARLMGDAHA